MAGENQWGYTRIIGELKKLGIKPPSKNTVKKILKAAGFEPGPKRGEGTWDDFLKQHAVSLWQCDFFSKRILTMKGIREVDRVNIGLTEQPASFEPRRCLRQLAQLDQLNQPPTRYAQLLRDFPRPKHFLTHNSPLTKNMRARHSSALRPSLIDGGRCSCRILHSRPKFAVEGCILHARIRISL
jgi:hypothetical protein